MLNLTSKYKINAKNHKFHKSLSLSHPKNHPKKQVSQVPEVVNKTI